MFDFIPFLVGLFSFGVFAVIIICYEDYIKGFRKTWTDRVQDKIDRGVEFTPSQLEQIDNVKTIMKIQGYMRLIVYPFALFIAVITIWLFYLYIHSSHIAIL